MLQRKLGTYFPCGNFLNGKSVFSKNASNFPLFLRGKLIEMINVQGLAIGNILSSSNSLLTCGTNYCTILSKQIARIFSFSQHIARVFCLAKESPVFLVLANLLPTYCSWKWTIIITLVKGFGCPKRRVIITLPCVKIWWPNMHGSDINHSLWQNSVPQKLERGMSNP